MVSARLVMVSEYTCGTSHVRDPWSIELAVQVVRQPW
jgi:hypothetical protein